MNGEAKVALINRELERGNTIYVSNYLRVWKVTPKTHQKFVKIGRPVFVGRGNSVYMTSGNRYLCCDGCKFTVEGSFDD